MPFVGFDEIVVDFGERDVVAIKEDGDGIESGEIGLSRAMTSGKVKVVGGAAHEGQ